MSDEPTEQAPVPAPVPAPDGGEPAAGDGPSPATAPADKGFAVSIVAPDGARRDWPDVGGYLLVAFDRHGRIAALDSNMPTEGCNLAAKLAVRAFVDAPLDVALADFAKRESRRRPGILAARVVPHDAPPRNGRILPG